MIVRRFRDAEAVAEAGARVVVEASRESILARGAFRIALAGGSTPRMLYRRLRDAPVDWHRVDVFFGDERAVPPSDDASNYKTATDALLGHVAIDASRVHRVQAELGAEEAARRYEAELGTEPLDLVLLGMGADGHTASLFPGDVSVDLSRRVAAAQGPAPHTERVTLTFATIAEARAAAFLVTGAGKAEMLARVLADVRAGSRELPAARIRARGAVTWLIDEDAAQRLEPDEGVA